MGAWLWDGNVKSVNSNSLPWVSAPIMSASSVSKKVRVCELGPYVSTLIVGLVLLSFSLRCVCARVLLARQPVRARRDANWNVVWTPRKSERHVNRQTRTLVNTKNRRRRTIWKNDGEQIDLNGSATITSTNV